MTRAANEIKRFMFFVPACVVVNYWQSEAVVAGPCLCVHAPALAIAAIPRVHGVDLDVLFVGEDAADAEEHQRAGAADLGARRFETIGRLEHHGLIRLGVGNGLREFFLAPIERLLLRAQQRLGGLVDALDAGDLLRR